MRETDGEMMEGYGQGRNERMQPKEEKIIKNINKQWHPGPVCDPLWTGSLLFVDNPWSSSLFTRLTAYCTWHLLKMCKQGAFTRNKRWRKGQDVAIVGLASG